jgi:hypothetical protein
MRREDPRRTALSGVGVLHCMGASLLTRCDPPYKPLQSIPPSHIPTPSLQDITSFDPMAAKREVARPAPDPHPQDLQVAARIIQETTPIIKVRP